MFSLIRALPRFTRRAVRRPEVVVFGARAWLLAPAVELGLAVLGFERTLRTIEKLTPRAPRTPRKAALSVAEATPVVAVAFRPHRGLRGQCLSRALVQYALHRRDGVPARLVIGVRRDEASPIERPNVDAHAWIEAPLSPACTDFKPLLVAEASP